MTQTTEAAPAGVVGQDDQPHAAVIEIVERHTGPRYPDVGVESILRPNHLRIDGVSIFATNDQPALVEDIELDGESRDPFTVTVRVFARALQAGGRPRTNPLAETVSGVNVGAIIDVPDLNELRPGETLERPWVLLNGRRVYTAGNILVGKMATSGDGRTVATVTLPLLCRRLIVDDESTD